MGSIIDGSNIIYRFLMDNRELIKPEDKNIIKVFFEIMSKYNDNDPINMLSLFEQWDIVYDLLNPKVYETKNRDVIWAGHLVNYINSCLSLNKVNEAYNLIIKNSKDAIKAFSVRKDIRHKILLQWAEIIVKSKIDLMDSFNKAIELLEIAIDDIEERRKVYHKSERAYIGDSAIGLYKYYLQIQTLLYNTVEVRAKDKQNIKEKIEAVLGKLTPRAITEKKQYFIKKSISQELVQMEQDFKILYDELRVMQTKKDYSSSEEYTNKARKVNELLETLKEEHPYYMPLPTYESIKFSKIQECLKKDEMFYQYIITKFGIVHVILTKVHEEIGFSFTETDKLEAVIIKELGKALQFGYKNNDETLMICDILSEVLYTPAIKYTNNNHIDRIYVISDVSATFFSANLVRFNGKWLIDNINSIVNIIDPNVLIEKEQNEKLNNEIIVKIFGKPQDKALAIAEKWLKTYKGEVPIKAILDYNNEINNIVEMANNQKLRAVIVLGHGVSDPNASIYDGAIGIEGNKKIVWMDELSEACQNAENFILISCRGGAPYEGQNETNTGVWGSIFERPLRNIIMCKWDVPIDTTLKILETMLKNLVNKEWDFSKALLIAQKEVASEQKTHPSSWAGIEFWKN